MKKRLVLVLLVLACAATDVSWAADDELLVYDAQEKELIQLRAAGKSQVEYYNARDRIAIQVERGRCGTAYRVQVNERTLPESAPGVRGLGDVEGLITGLLKPATFGAAALERAAVTEGDTAGFVLQMQTLEGAKQIGIELRSEWRSLSVEVSRLDDEQQDYLFLLAQLLGVDPLSDQILRTLEEDASWSAAATKPQTFPAADVAVRDLSKKIQAASLKPEEKRTCKAFNAMVEVTNLRLAETARLRTRVEASSAASYVSGLETLVQGLRARMGTYGDKLEAVQGAVEIAVRVRNQTSGVTNDEAFLLYLKRLRQEFKDEPVSLEVLQQLARSYARAGKIGIDAALVELGSLAKSKKIDLEDTQKVVLALKQKIQKIDRALQNRVLGFNHALEASVLDLEKLRRRSIDQVRDVASVGPWTTNNDLTVKVFEKDVFEMPDLATLAEIRPAAGEVTAVVEEAPDDDFQETVSRIYEVHKTYRFNAGTGLAWSGLGDTEFAVRSVPRLDDNGNEVFDEDGNPVRDNRVFESGSDSNDQQPILVFTYYLGRELDVYPGAASRRPAFGVALGFSLDNPSENIFLGGIYQPILGVQLMAGFHRGRVTALQDGIELEQVLSPGVTEPPTRQRWEDDSFFGVIFDASIFKRLFGGNGEGS